MNDPHVAALVYNVTHGDRVAYEKPEPLQYDADQFSVSIIGNVARFDMKEHFATEHEARAVVDPFIRAWVVHTSLNEGAEMFDLVFDKSEIVDRNPPPGTVLRPGTDRMKIQIFAPRVFVTRKFYPSPPSRFFASADVESMHDRYARFREGRETLASMAYFCLTVVEASVEEGPSSRRDRAAEAYHIHRDVLNMLGRLTDTKGGQEARKAKGASQEFTSAERRWIEEVVKALIRRAAQLAADPEQALSQITMATLSNL